MNATLKMEDFYNALIERQCQLPSIISREAGSNTFFFWRAVAHKQGCPQCRPMEPAKCGTILLIVVSLGID
jgi:hypothetical protein